MNRQSYEHQAARLRKPYDDAKTKWLADPSEWNRQRAMAEFEAYNAAHSALFNRYCGQTV